MLRQTYLNLILAAGGSGAAVSVQNGGNAVGAEGTANFVAGSGIVNSMTALGNKVNIQQSVDSAAVFSKVAAQTGQGLICLSQEHTMFAPAETSTEEARSFAPQPRLRKGDMALLLAGEIGPYKNTDAVLAGKKRGNQTWR